MARIILEDMKLNRKRIPTLEKKEVEVSAIQPKINIIRKDLYPEEKEDINEEKIEAYIKDRVSPKRLSRTPQINHNRKPPYLIIILMMIVVLGLYGLGQLKQRANIVISAKHQILDYQTKQFLASKDNQTDGINFEIMIVSDKKDKKIILTEPKEVSLKAQGSITLYNEYSLIAQKILAGSYLLDENGKTYKIDQAISIPGYKLDENKKIIPGTAVVSITSFLPGDEYNGEPNLFHLSSFKGTNKYLKIYAKLKEPLLGGASGVVYALDEKNITDLNSLAESFKAELLKRVLAQVPTGYILYPEALSYTYKINNSLMSKTPEAIVPIEGTMAVVLLKETSLLASLKKVSFPKITEGELAEITMPDLIKLNFAFLDKDQIITKDLSQIAFSLSGQIEAIWQPNLEQLKTKLMGVKKTNVLPIFGVDPGIGPATVKIFPPWQNFIPNNISKININLK